MKNICKIHPLTYITALIFIGFGFFKIYLSFMFVLIIHELGHIIFALIFKWHIKQIVILPLGFLLKFEDNLNKPLIEEFLIAIMGVVFQSIFVLIYHNNNILICSNIILFFNLLPIYPLDGSKIINVFLNKISTFKKSYNFSLWISFVIIIIFVSISIINLKFILFISLIPLLINIIDLIISKKQIFMKFLLERYLYHFSFKKYKYINNVKEMKRDYYHLFIGDNIITEREYLKMLFKN